MLHNKTIVKELVYLKEKMKNLLILLFIFFSSCAFPVYTHYSKTTPVVDLRDDNWLIHPIGTVSFRQKKELANMVKDKFRKLSIANIHNVNEYNFKYVLPNEFKVKLEKDIFEVLAKTTKFRYLIEIEATILKNQIGDLIIMTPIQETNKENYR